MTTIALEYIHAARHALDEGAIQTARCLLDSIEKHLSEPIALPRSKSPLKPQVQPTLIGSESSEATIHSAICEYLRCRVGEVINHASVCRSIETESGIQLTWADRQGANKTQVWRVHVSASLTKLKASGVLSRKQEDGSRLPRTNYLVLREP